MRYSDAMGAVVELAASQHGAFSRRQAATIGLSRRQIQAMAMESLLDEPVRGVLVFRAVPPTWRQRLMVATLVGPGYVAGFRAAAYLLAVDGFRTWPPPPIEVIGGPSCRRIRGIDVVQHWTELLPPDDIIVVDGIPCTGFARTTVDVCGLADADLALRAVDHFQRKGHSLNWLRLTAERIHRPGQSGTRVVRELLNQRQQGGRVPDTWFERLVERCLAIPGLPPWVPQFEVFDDGGRLVGRPDLACPQLLYGVEAHSREFHFGRLPESIDQHRENRFGAVGWQLTYVGWYHAEDPATVAATIEVIARRRAAQLGVPLPWAA